MFELKEVYKSFISEGGQVEAVSNVCLRIDKGEIFGIIGSSGAGKSTLIRCLNLLEKPEKGKVIFKGHDLLSLSKKQMRHERKKIGMVFQNFNLLASRTVFENVAFPIGTKTKSEVKEKVLALLEIVGISDKVNNYPNQLSGGQKQRVAIARALANDPHVLLCDEATSALDPQTTASILSLLKELNEKLNLTIILITHEMSVIKSICHRVAIMDKGKIIEVDTVINIFTNPKKPLTKSFIQESFNHKEIRNLIDKNKLFKENSHLYEFIYKQESASKALIATLIKKYQLEINIIAGKIEIISGESIGHLVIIIEGEDKSVKSALRFLSSQGVLVKEFEENE
ncbi:MAG: ATP-binding cassette domain-containing protein [Tissierellia bacterium]|nr:ATP-binding cassette domain-containing protein [Tissierellia bacterium]